MRDYSVTAISSDGPVAVLSVLVGGVVHLVRVTPQGHAMVPAELARHYQREAIEADCRAMAEQAAHGWVA